MSTNVGTLTIEMAANIVRLQQDMDKARKSVEGTMAQISKAAGLAGAALGAIGVGLSVTAFAGWIKSGIDAADALDELSQRTGVAVEELAGLQLAFKLGGVDAGALQGAMTKLSVAVAGGNEALKAMGIETRNTDGTLKSTRQVLGEVADRFDTYEDGASKAALAVQIFGKSGTDMLSVLAGGSKALDEFDAMARKLGLTIDAETAAQAAKFNDTLDLMGQGFKGIATQVAANLLPTLSGLADEFFTTMTEGDRLKDISDLISKALKGVYAVAVLVIEVVYTLGKTLATAGKQFMAVMRGDFSGAVDLGKEYMADLQKDWMTALDRADRAWNTTGSTAVEAMASAARATKKEAPIVNEETKKMAAEAAKLEEQYKKLINSIEDKTGTMLLEAQGTEKLTEGQKLALKTMQDIQNGTLKLTDAQKLHVTATLEAMLATEQQTEAMKDLSKTQKEAQELSNKLTEAQWKEVDALRDGNIKLAQQNDVLRIGEAAVRAREVAVLRSTATDLEFQAANEGGNAALEEQARLLRQRADLMEDNTVLEEAKKAADEWKKTSESIESSLTDALMRGFESGKDFGKNMADTLVNMFKTLVLRPIIQPIAQGASNIILKMMGMALPGSAAAGGGGGSSGGMMSGFALSMSQFGSYMGTGFMNAIMGGGSAGFGATQSLFASGQYAQAAGMGFGTLAGYGAGAFGGMAINRGISNGYKVSSGMGTLQDIATVAATAIAGPIGGIVAGAISGVVNRAFGRKQTDMGIQGTLTTAEGIQGQMYQFLKGGWFRSNKTVLSELSNEIEAAFDGSIELITKQTRGYAIALGLPAGEIDKYTQEIKLSFQGLTEEEINRKIQETLVAFQEGIVSQYATALEPLQLAGETFSQTIERLMAIQNVSAVLNEFGGAFTTFATASVTARQNIIELAGGLDALVQKTQGFIANFYTREEQAGITARGVVQALEAAGFTAAQIAALETRADFRTLLESIDVNTELGQQQFVALLDLQQAYSELVPIMDEQTKSLAELIEAAPQVEILQKMFETDAEYQARVQTAEEAALTLQQQLVDTMGGVDLSVQNLSVIMANGLDRIAASTAAAIAESQAAAANAIAMAQASAERAAAAEAAAAAAAAVAATTVWDGGGAATGGYINSPTLVGEAGPEIFDPRTSQVYTNASVASTFGGDAIAAEIRALRDEVAEMRYETRATAVNTSKIAKLQDNWDVRGLTVKTDADQPLDTVAV